MSDEVTLIRKTRRCRNAGERQAIQHEPFRGRNPNLHLKGVRGHANFSSEHSIQMKGAEVNQSRKVSQRDTAIVMRGDVFTSRFHGSVFFSRRSQLSALLGVTRD